LKFPVIDTESLGIVKTQGFALRPFEQVVPVTFHPENIQLAAGLAVTLTICPAASEHAEGHDGSTEPCPTIAVVRVADDAGHAPCAQVMVTVRVGARRVNPPDVPLTMISYWLPGWALRVLTIRVVTNDGSPHDWANDADNSPS